MEGQLAGSGLDWDAVRPVKLTDGPLTRNVRASDRVTVKPVSRADVAWHILALAENPDPGRQRTPVITTGAARTAPENADPVRPAGYRQPAAPQQRPPRQRGEAAHIRACPSLAG